MTEVSAFISRLVRQLGTVGLLVIAAALIFGFVAGGVVIRLEQASQTASQSEQQGESEKQDTKQSDKETSQQKAETGDKEDQSGQGGSHATGARTNEPPDTQND